MSINTKKQSPSNKKWIGLAHIAPRPGNNTLSGAIGAIVSAIALAGDAEDFGQKLTAVLNSYEFDVTEIEDVELVEHRSRKFPAANEVLKLADAISDENPVVLGTFHTYKVKP